MEKIIVILIVAIAAGFIGRNFYQKYVKKNQSCNCGCSSCPTDVSTCELPEAKEHLLTRSGQESEK
jgi:Tfp pilus assembly major pilin PilA